MSPNLEVSVESEPVSTSLPAPLPIELPAPILQETTDEDSMSDDEEPPIQTPVVPTTTALAQPQARPFENLQFALQYPAPNINNENLKTTNNTMSTFRNFYRPETRLNNQARNINDIRPDVSIFDSENRRFQNILPGDISYIFQVNNESESRVLSPRDDFTNRPSFRRLTREMTDRNTSRRGRVSGTISGSGLVVENRHGLSQHLSENVRNNINARLDHINNGLNRMRTPVTEAGDTARNSTLLQASDAITNFNRTMRNSRDSISRMRNILDRDQESIRQTIDAATDQAVASLSNVDRLVDRHRNRRDPIQPDLVDIDDLNGSLSRPNPTAFQEITRGYRGGRGAQGLSRIRSSRESFRDRSQTLRNSDRSNRETSREVRSQPRHWVRLDSSPEPAESKAATATATQQPDQNLADIYSCYLPDNADLIDKKVYLKSNNLDANSLKIHNSQVFLARSYSLFLREMIYYLEVSSFDTAAPGFSNFPKTQNLPPEQKLRSILKSIQKIEEKAEPTFAWIFSVLDILENQLKFGELQIKANQNASFSADYKYNFKNPNLKKILHYLGWSLLDNYNSNSSHNFGNNNYNHASSIFHDGIMDNKDPRSAYNRYTRSASSSANFNLKWYERLAARQDCLMYATSLMKQSTNEHGKMLPTLLAYSA